jgi:hypothetical protein
MDTTQGAITATTVAIPITEAITTLGGRTITAAIEFTSTTSIITTATKGIITTATKAHRLV